MKLYYWRGRPNFGDQLSSLLLMRFARLRSDWSEPEHAELVLVGSVLDRLPGDWQGVVAGAGKLHERTRLDLRLARVLAVRGPLTAADLRGDVVLADPGLLADELVEPEDKRYELGIVAHWSDTTLEHDPRFTRYRPKVIRVDGDPLEAIREIGRCKKVVSSSLHGVIVADAFGIPRRIEISPRMFSHAHQEGGLFKWRDYSASLGMELEIGVTQEADRNVVAEKQFELFDVLEELRAIFGRAAVA